MCLQSRCGINIADNQWKRFDVIYHDFGAVVLIYETWLAAQRAIQELWVARFDEKPLLVLLLPSIQVYLTQLLAVFVALFVGI